MGWSDPKTAKKILESYKTFAVVGCSAKPWRASFGVATYLQEAGYRVLCINPNESECLVGAPCYPDLATAAADEDIEVVDIFRRADQAGTHVDEAIAIGAKAVWMQLGVIDEAAAERAAAAGLDVVMDRCPKIDHPSLLRR
jgi:predicted CoA-binding protein